MKLCTFRRQGAAGPGLILHANNGPALGKNPAPETRVLDLAGHDAAAVLGYTPHCLEDILEKGAHTLAPLRHQEWPQTALHALGGITLLPPVGARAKVLGVAGSPWAMPALATTG